MKIVKRIFGLSLLAMPLAAGAVSSIDDLISLTGDTLQKVVPLLIAVAVVILLIAIIGYITAGDNDDKKGKYKAFMIYAIIGLFIMVSIWGLVNILAGTFNLNNDVPNPNLLPNI